MQRFTTRERDDVMVKVTKLALTFLRITRGIKLSRPSALSRMTITLQIKSELSTVILAGLKTFKMTTTFPRVIVIPN